MSIYIYIKALSIMTRITSWSCYLLPAHRVLGVASSQWLTLGQSLPSPDSGTMEPVPGGGRRSARQVLRPPCQHGDLACQHFVIHHSSVALVLSRQKFYGPHLSGPGASFCLLLPLAAHPLLKQARQGLAVGQAQKLLPFPKGLVV